MEIQEVRKVEDIWSYVQQCMKVGRTGGGEVWWDELIHGGRHMRHVLQETRLIIETCDLGEKLASCLLAAASVHDLGRIGATESYSGVSNEQLRIAVDAARIDSRNANYIDHAALSAELFRLMPIEDLTVEEREAVYGAVHDHSIGLVGKGILRAETLEEKILGLLVVADHCGDAASPDGVARAIRALKGKPVLSSVFSFEHLSKYGSMYVPVADAGKYKNESVLAHLVYNYQASQPILSAVFYLVSGRYWKEDILPRMQMYASIIDAYLILQAEKDARQ